MSIRAVAASFLLVLTGCIAVQGASKNALPLVRAHAESDIDCPPEEIKIEQKYGGLWEARGCGHKAVYNTACDMLHCVVNGDGKAVPDHARPDPVGQPGTELR